MAVSRRASKFLPAQAPIAGGDGFRRPALEQLAEERLQVLERTSTQGGVGGDHLHVGPLFLGPEVLVGDDLRPHRLRRAGSR